MTIELTKPAIDPAIGLSVRQREPESGQVNAYLRSECACQESYYSIISVQILILHSLFLTLVVSLADSDPGADGVEECEHEEQGPQPAQHPIRTAPAPAAASPAGSSGVSAASGAPRSGRHPDLPSLVGLRRERLRIRPTSQLLSWLFPVRHATEGGSAFAMISLDPVVVFPAPRSFFLLFVRPFRHSLHFLLSSLLSPSPSSSCSVLFRGNARRLDLARSSVVLSFLLFSSLLFCLSRPIRPQPSASSRHSRPHLTDCPRLLQCFFLSVRVPDEVRTRPGADFTSYVSLRKVCPDLCNERPPTRVTGWRGQTTLSLSPDRFGHLVLTRSFGSLVAVPPHS